MQMQDPEIQGSTRRALGRRGLSELTSRQLQIAVMLSQGATDRDIVEALNCSTYTVRAEIDKIMEKLGAKNRAHIAFFVGVQQGVDWCLTDP